MSKADEGREVAHYIGSLIDRPAQDHLISRQVLKDWERAIEAMATALEATEAQVEALSMIMRSSLAEAMRRSDEDDEKES